MIKKCIFIYYHSFNFYTKIDSRYHLIVRYYLKIGDYNSLKNCVKRLGKVQPTLWLQALTGLRDNMNASNLLSQILQVIGMHIEFLQVFIHFHIIDVILLKQFL